VLIDDLISKGTDEPYRMFTSRAEFRTLLRQDNADLRLTELSYRKGFAKEERLRAVEEKQQNIGKIKELLQETYAFPEEINNFLEQNNSAPIREKQKIGQLLLRPEININQLSNASNNITNIFNSYTTDQLEQTEIQVKYDVYIQKEKALVARMLEMEELAIPDNFDYKKINSISTEAREKLQKIRPNTLGQASRISGITPSDVQILMVYMGR
jgi:tRNA uridine 5-carboxymethylaminomethyl modification enzyme